jgi:putative ABC transport system permease protein
VENKTGEMLMKSFWQDLRYGARMLGKKPGFMAVAVLSLAAGLALTATTLAIVNAYLVRAMPFPAANRLYHVIHAAQGQGEPRGAVPLDWKTLSDVVEIADNSTLARFYIGEGAGKQEAQGLSAAPGALELLGVRPALGRAFLEEDFRQGTEQVILLSHALWRDRFGSDPNVVGRDLRARQSNLAEPLEPFRIIGVLPSEFHLARDYSRGPMEFAVPLRISRQTYLVRLRQGVSPAFAEQRITEAVRSIATSFPPNWTGVHLESIHERYVAGLRPMLVSITIAAGLVLLIVCANVAVLTLLRALRRQKEIAVRVALGAGRWQITRMLLAEACLICGAALAGALALTKLALSLLAPIIEERLGRGAPGGTAAIALDTTVLLAVGGAGILIALSLAFITLLTPWQRRLADTLRREGRSGTDGPAMRRMRSSLIVLEVAASLALLVGCGLMIRSVLKMVNADLGFQTEHIVRARIALPQRTYPDEAAFLRFYDRLNDRLTATSSAPFALTNFIPFYEYPQQGFEIDSAANERLNASIMSVSDGYFGLLGINIKQGRGFTATDRPEAEPVAVISEALARRLWPNSSAVGQRIRPADQPDRNVRAVWRTIVGVARDVRQTQIDEDLKDIYLPFLQTPSRYAPLYFRTDHPQAFSHEKLRAAVAEIDAEVLITGGTSLASEGNKLLSGPRFLMATLTGFALFAALLALLGIYGVTAYAVQQQEREVAIRMAIGATPGAVIRMFLKEGSLVLALGIVGGLFGTRAVARLLASEIHGVQPFDVLTLAMACVFMIAAGLLATWWPARRAATQNPLAALNEN